MIDKQPCGAQNYIMICGKQGEQGKWGFRKH